MTISLTTTKSVPIRVPSTRDADSVTFTGFSLSKPFKGTGEISANIEWLWVVKGKDGEPDEPVIVGDLTLTPAQTKQLLKLNVNGKFGVEINRLLHKALNALGEMPDGTVQDDE